jgi:16S rRNA (uracil1498-N3)-methyltransferase
VPALSTGEILLDATQSHHLRDVLRLKIGSSVELFDDTGLSGLGVVTSVDSAAVSVRVDEIHSAEAGGELIVASAVPKGDRADWMIEKLSELGVNRFIPLQTDRSVVHPTGRGKLDRWNRIATESAKQSRRAGVMRIEELTLLEAALRHFSGVGISPTLDQITNVGGTPAPRACAWHLSTLDDAVPMRNAIGEPADRLTLFIGPEGGWSDQELLRFVECGLTGVRLTATILRVETAAIAAAAIAATLVVNSAATKPDGESNPT